MIVRERYLARIRPFYNKDLVKVITGFRRSGKSVLLQQIREELAAEPEKVLFLNFESHLHARLLDYRQLDEHVAAFARGKTGKLYLFFDEIQQVAGWEKSINSYRVSYDCDIYITGSNSSLLSSELSTHIAGRYAAFTVYPLSFAEFKQTGQGFDAYLKFGGLPFLQQLNYQQEACLVYLNDVYNSVVLKDIVSRHQIRDVDLLTRLIHYVVLNNGKVFSARSIEKYFKSVGRKASVDTILNYLSHCQEAFLFYTLKNLDLKSKEFLTAGDKYYMVDHGLRLPLVQNPQADIAQTLENIVLLEALSRGYQVSIGRVNGREIDFVLRRGEEQRYLQVAYLLADSDTVEREFGVYRQVQDNHPKYVLSMDPVDFSREGILHRNIVDFLEMERW
ncbi:MAG: ATP-binding protein [Clostridiales bacterium]|nr:ATP-binding protein [Clostridiales bacterium]